MDKNINISVVSYLNTLPLHYGLKKAHFDCPVMLMIDHPAECARKLISGQADIGLVPVVILKQLPGSYIAGEYCISALKYVRSVILLGNCAVSQMKRIYLDNHSKTSVELLKILCHHHWKVNPEFVPFTFTDAVELANDEGMLAIGDKTFAIASLYNYCYDLANEWNNMTGLPFVFAAWIARRPLPVAFIAQFNQALAYGTAHINEAVSDQAGNAFLSHSEIADYLENNISFPLDDRKRKGLEMFLSLIK